MFLIEMEQEKIKQEAKEILGIFSQALEKVKEDIGESYVEREEDRREETETTEEADEEFRKIMFENAPNKKGDFIVAEKGKWVE